MATIYSYIDKNKRETWVVIFIFMVVIAALGWFIGEVFVGEAGIPFIGFALIVSGISSYVSYYNSDKIVLSISGAREVKKEEDEYLHNLVENLCIGAGLPKPRIYIIDDTAPNAFATGRDPEHAVICFTTGIISKLDKLELEGVIAHELSHIGNYDIRLMSIVSVLVGTITLLVDWFTRGRFYRGRSSRGSKGAVSGVILIVGLLFLIISPIIAQLIKMAIGRTREFLADSTAALLTRYPDGLAAALRKISADREVLEVANSATAHLYIDDPIKGRAETWLSKLFDTHPPVEERVRRLIEM